VTSKPALIVVSGLPDVSSSAQRLLPSRFDVLSDTDHYSRPTALEFCT
jgi:hypothetical protein